MYAKRQISLIKTLGGDVDTKLCLEKLYSDFDLYVLITSDHNLKISNPGAQLHI